MRKTNLKFLTCLATTISAFCALVNSVQAQNVLPLLATDAAWQYYQAGNQPANIGGHTWRTNNYDDSAWTPGNGLFQANEDNTAAYPPFNTFMNRTVDGVPGGTTNITYYFRTHFNFPSNTANAFLYFTNWVDDGLILYLNGVRLYDIRVPGINPGWNVYSSGGPAAEGTPELRTFFSTPLLKTGDNVLAVELHDGNVGSSDVVFGLGLAYSFPELINITRHPPAKIEAVELDDIALSVDVVGTDPRFWWFKNNVFIQNATNRTLLLNNIPLTGVGTGPGTYHVVVSNSVSGARGSNTVITVVPDTFGPRLVDAYVPIGFDDRVILQFNEDIHRTHPSSGNVSNYIITILGNDGLRRTNQIVVTQAIAGVGSAQVRLTLATNLNFNTNYSVCISNIMDNRNNLIAWNSCVPVGFQQVTNPIPFQSFWFYHPWDFPPEGGDWRALNYVEDPLRWAENQASFFGSFSGTNQAACSELGSTMSIALGTVYFRKKFVMPTNLVGVPFDITLTHAIDDGAVFWLNGNELYRFNMNPGSGEPPYGTRTPSAVDNICRSVALQDVVFQRTNILAVQVHQNNPGGVNDLDAGFEAQINLQYVSYSRRLTQSMTNRIVSSNHSPTQISVFFSPTNLANLYGWTLQSATNIGDPWREVQTSGTNRFILPKTNPRRIFRAVKVH